jgi:hypothetical protein
LLLEEHSEIIGVEGARDMSHPRNSLQLRTDDQKYSEKRLAEVMEAFHLGRYSELVPGFHVYET